MREKHASFRMLAMGTLLVTGPVAHSLAQSPAPGSRRASRHVHHTVVGDLSTARAAKAIDERIRQAGDANADTFVLELTGDRWRADLVHEVAESIRASRVRTVVWLHDPSDKSVGAGQAVLGMIASECWIDPGTRIVRRPGDDDAVLAPKGTNHEKFAQETTRWAAEAGRDRNADALLPRLLIGDPAPMWAVDELGDGALRLTPAEPKPAPAAPFRIVPLERRTTSGDAETVLDADLAVSLHLAAGKAGRLADIFTPRGISPNSSGALPVDGKLDAILESAARSLESLDRDIEAIETELRSKPRDQRVNTRTFYRELGARVLERTEKARTALSSCEAALAKDPEIARTPPPGTTTVGADPDTHAARWRQTFQKRRDQIARLEKKARGFAGQ